LGRRENRGGHDQAEGVSRIIEAHDRDRDHLGYRGGSRSPTSWGQARGKHGTEANAIRGAQTIHQAEGDLQPKDSDQERRNLGLRHAGSEPGSGDPPDPVPSESGTKAGLHRRRDVQASRLSELALVSAFANPAARAAYGRPATLPTNHGGSYSTRRRARRPSKPAVVPLRTTAAKPRRQGGTPSASDAVGQLTAVGSDGRRRRSETSRPVSGPRRSCTNSKAEASLDAEVPGVSGYRAARSTSRSLVLHVAAREAAGTPASRGRPFSVHGSACSRPTRPAAPRVGARSSRMSRARRADGMSCRK